MSTRLVILCTSERPDPSLNVIMHGVITAGFTDFVLVMVGDQSDPSLGEKAARLHDDVSTLVRNLQSGTYWKRDPHNGPDAVVALDDPARFARLLASLNWGSLRVTRMGISENDLPEFLAKEATAGSSFDVTSCKNGLVVGVTAALVAESKSSAIYTFELRKNPTYDQADLLPALEQQQYTYRNLADGKLLKGAVARINRFSLTRKNFLVISVVAASCFAVVAGFLSQTAVYALLTGLASFASIVSALMFFVRS